MSQANLSLNARRALLKKNLHRVAAFDRNFNTKECLYDYEDEGNHCCIIGAMLTAEEIESIKELGQNKKDIFWLERQKIISLPKEYSGYEDLQAYHDSALEHKCTRLLRRYINEFLGEKYVDEEAKGQTFKIVGQSD